LALKLYIAYGTAADQVIALRLQALAAVNGLSVYVPPAYTRHPAATALEPQSEAKLMDSNIILGVVTTGVSEVCRQELNTAQSLNKKPIVMADLAWAPSLQDSFPGNVVVIDPTNPAAAEQQFVQILNQAKIEQAGKIALIALGTLALGLMLFAPQE
jgi:hypothetical protein